MRSRVFTAHNGAQRTFWFREGTNDESCIIASFVDDYYGILEQGFKKGDVLIDLGAHIGAVTALMATIPGVIIYAVEALPENYKILKKNLSGEQLARVTLYQRAISGKEGTTELFYGDKSTESGRVHKYMGTANLSDSKDFASKRKSVRVKNLTLHELFLINRIEKCKFIKTDTEGAEYGTFDNASDSILKRIETIRGEYHLGDYRELLERLPMFEDITPNTLTSEDFIWRNKNAR